MSNANYIAVDAATVLAVAPCISSETTRYYLNGIFVEPNPLHDGGVIAVATDGHTMAVRRCAKGRCDRSTILKISKATLKALRAKNRWGISLVAILGEQPVESDAGPRTRPTAALYVVGHPPESAIEYLSANPQGDLVLHVEAGNAAIDATFPDWQRVVPAEIADRPMARDLGFNSAMLVRFSRAGYESCHFGAAQVIRTLCSADGGPAVVLNGDSEFFGLAMPHRMTASEMPAWFTRAKAEETSTPPQPEGPPEPETAPPPTASKRKGKRAAEAAAA